MEASMRYGRLCNVRTVRLAPCTVIRYLEFVGRWLRLRRVLPSEAVNQLCRPLPSNATKTVRDSTKADSITTPSDLLLVVTCESQFHNRIMCVLSFSS
eukprot:3672684-Amphidinium_carterae.1